MRTIVGWCLANRSVVLLFGLLMVGAGVFSIFRLNQELLPDVTFPTVYIVTSDVGASPEVVDRDVSVPMADALTGLPHAKHVHSNSSQGFSTVWVEFDLDSNLKDDTDAVNQRVNQLSLPSSAGKPLVQTFSFSAAPTMVYSLAARDADLVRTTTEAKDVIAPALESVPGVAQVKVVGGERDGVTITLDPVRLAQKQISPFQVTQALEAAQVDVPAGVAVEGGSGLPVQVLGSVKSVGDLRDIRVGVSAGKPVTLADVADVREAPQPLNGISRTDGSPALSLQVIKASNGNAVNVSRDVRAKLASLHLDENDDLQLVEDTATDIQSSLNGLLEEGLLGALLAVLVIWLFLGSLRATLVTAVSLPTSVMVALAATNTAGYSLNVLTLAGLTIAIGRIVDDAIVVLENSYRHLQRGESPTEAALNGATEVWAPVVSSTLTTVAVFLPIGTLGGVISKFFLPFSVTVTMALLGSLLVALTVIPVLVSFFLERGRGEAGPGRLVRAYRPVLAWSLHRAWHKLAVLVLAAVLLGLAFVPIAAGKVPINFLSSEGSGELTGSVVLPPGTTADETSTRLQAFEKRAQDDPQVKLIGVTLASTDYGGYSAGFSANVARLTILVKDRHQGSATRDRLGKVLDDLYGKGNWSLQEVGFVQTGNFRVNLSGRDVDKLRDASDAVVSRLREDPNLTNVQASLETEQPELVISVDQQKAAAHGLDPQQVAGLVAQVLNPRPLGTLAGSDEPVTLRLADPKLLTPANLAVLPLGPGVQLKDVATVGRQAAPVGIQRTDGVRQVSVSADFVTQDASGISAEATQRLSNVALPTGVTFATGGASSDINEAFGEMYQAIAVAIAIVALILVAFFRSVVTPFVILLTMPLALIGGMLALFVTQQPLGLPALMGVLMVFGIVVSNAILLVDFSDRAARTRPVRDALLLAGSIRLRPILMTAVATIVALLPIAVGLSGGGGGLISQSLAVVVEGGLVSSTGLTLLVIPVVYSLLKRRRAEISVEDESSAPPAERPPWMHFRESAGP